MVTRQGSQGITRGYFLRVYPSKANSSVADQKVVRVAIKNRVKAGPSGAAGIVECSLIPAS
jgi:hypothetical protein